MRAAALAMAGTAHFSVSEQLRDGRSICIRAIRPDDKAGLTKAFHALDPKSVYRRVFHMKKELTADEWQFMKLAKRLTAAMTALPMAMPLVSALVVLPTASRSARIWRARL